MYPLADDELPLCELVDHWDGPWERESSSAKLYICLFQCFWRGELSLRGPLSPLPWERRKLLEAIYELLPSNEAERMFTLLEQAARDAGANVHLRTA